MNNDELLCDILVKATIELVKERIIKSPFKVGLSYYDAVNGFGKYHLFPNDLAKGLLESFHPIWKQGLTLENYKKKLNNLQINGQTTDLCFRFKTYEKDIVGASYENLKKIKFRYPLVFSDYLDICLSQEKEYHSESLYDRLTYQSQKDSSTYWDLGSFLEAQLFSIPSNGIYTCLFFLLTKNPTKDDFIIYSINIFTPTIEEGEMAGKTLSRLFSENDKVFLLGEFNKESLVSILNEIRNGKSFNNLKMDLLKKIGACKNGEDDNHRKKEIGRIMEEVEKCNENELLKEIDNIISNNPTINEKSLEQIEFVLKKSLKNC